MQELSWLLGHKMQRVPVLFEASSEEALCPKSLSVPRRSQMSLLCLNLYPESHQDLLHTEAFVLFMTSHFGSKVLKILLISFRVRTVA